jgi:recombination protein RecA
MLPDRGLPCGVVELSAPRALGGSTSVALAAVRAAQTRGGASAWCAWLDPEGTLHAPGVVAAGVQLARMLVVRSPRAQLARIAVKVVASGAFEVVVVDFHAVPGAGTDRISSATEHGRHSKTGAAKRGNVRGFAAAWSAPDGRPIRSSGIAPEVWVRKLALAAEPSGMTVLLLTDASKPRAVPWPVALRIELSRPGPRDLVMRIAKDKRGRIGLAKTIPFHPVSKAFG